MKNKFPYISYITLIFLTLPFNIIYYKMEQGFVIGTLEKVVPYVIFAMLLIHSRILFFVIPIIIIQRLFDVLAYAYIGKFVLGMGNVIFETLQIVKLDYILEFASQEYMLIITIFVSLTLIFYFYYIVAKNVYIYLKNRNQNKNKLKFYFIQALIIILALLSFKYKSSKDIFFFEDIESKFKIKPVFVEKQPPISKYEGKTFDIDFYYVRGESVTDAHLSLYGYSRKTTPYLDSIKNQIKIYYNAVSPEVGSAGSDSQMYSQGYSLPDNDFFTKQTLFDEIKHQKIPYVFVGYEFGKSNWSYIYDHIMGKADKRIYKNDDSLGLADKMIANINSKPTFYWIMDGGSHVPYSSRSYDEHKVFSKEKAKSSKQQIINEYDDSIITLDKMIEKIHKFALQRQQQTGRKFVIWYTSDHSQVLYRDGSNWSTYALDKKTVLGRDVPFFIIGSENLKCKERLPKQPADGEYLNITQTFYWVLGSLCLYNGKELNINPPVIFND